MSTKTKKPAPPAGDIVEILLTSRHTLEQLLATEALYDLDSVAEITGLCVRYLRRLCHSGRVGHHKLLGRYYMTPAEVAALLTPVKASTATK